MPIDPDILAAMVADQIDYLVPTEATFRGATINIRGGEAPEARTFNLLGPTPGQRLEALIKREDADPAPASGETVTISGSGYKIVTVSPLPSITNPAFYRVTLALN